MKRLVIAAAGLLGLTAAGFAMGYLRPEKAPTPDQVTTVLAEQKAVATQTQGKAPKHPIYGLELGVSTEADILAWTTERGLSCPPEASLARTTVHYTCKGDIPTSLFPDRIIGGKITQLLFARTDTGGLHHFSSNRRYSLGDGAIKDYDKAVEATKLVLGEPKRAQLADAARLDNTQGIVRYATTWLFDDLELTISASRLDKDYITVSEIWVVPGVEAAAPLRPGGGPHGGKAPKASTNPHILSSGPPPASSEE